MNKRLFNYFIFILLLTFCFISFNYVFAQGIVEKPGTSDPNCPYEGCNAGNYTLNEIVKILPKVASWILGVSGSLALLAFIVGGVMFLISAGSSERVTKAKQVIFGAVIGLAIVFASYIIIGFIFTAMDVDLGSTSWAQSDWFSNQ